MSEVRSFVPTPDRGGPIEVPAWLGAALEDARPVDVRPAGTGISLSFAEEERRELHVRVTFDGSVEMRVQLDLGVSAHLRARVEAGLRAVLRQSGQLEELTRTAGAEAGLAGRENPWLERAHAALAAGYGQEAAELARSTDLVSPEATVAAAELLSFLGDAAGARRQLDRTAAVFRDGPSVRHIAQIAARTQAHELLAHLVTRTSALPVNAAYDDLRWSLCQVAIEAGAPDTQIEREVRSLAGRGHHPAARALFEIATWRNDLRAARAARPFVHEHDAAWCDARLLLLEGRDEEATARLDALVSKDPGDRESRMLLAERLAAAGDRTRAVEVFADLRGDDPAAILTDYLGRGAGNHYALVSLTRHLGAPDGPLPDRARKALRRLGLNRSNNPTFIEDAGNLRPATILRHRKQMIALQHQCVFRDPQDVLDDLRAAHEADPRSPYPLTYRGELLLWLGEYGAAEEVFATSRRLHDARWGFVGGGATMAMLGRRDAAEAIWAAFQGVPLEYWAIHCYRGDLLLNDGELDGAREQLEWAVSRVPHRLGAWPSLAIVADRQGDEGLVARATQEIRERCPALLAEALAQCGLEPEDDGDPPPRHPPEVYRCMRACLAGNRSSHIYSFFGADGRWRAHGAETMRYLATAGR